jgi:putative colanic acid biosynthesis acetyltransferase WcaF
MKKEVQSEIGTSPIKSELGFMNQFARFAWVVLWGLLVRPIPRRMFNGWKLIILRLFGAKVSKHAVVYSNARIYMPWNLEMDEYSVLGPEVDCYNVGEIKIGAHSVVSQKTYLCAASHDITKSNMPLITAPIIIEDYAWVAADAFIGMGVTIGQGAVIGARSVVFKDVEPWTVVGGNPAKFIKARSIKTFSS